MTNEGLNDGLVKANEELAKSLEAFHNRHQARHDELEAKLKIDKAKSDAYFSDYYQQQLARYYRIQKLLK